MEFLGVRLNLFVGLLELTISVCVIGVSASVATILSTTVVTTFVVLGVGCPLVSQSQFLS